MVCCSLSSPVGTLFLEERGGSLVRLDWTGPPGAAATPLLREAVDQINAYFEGRLRNFDLPLAPAGTAFQRRIWSAMAEIPYGETVTYGELAARAGSGARAVGGACGANPIPVILPCHRVVAANGGAGGYSGAGRLRTKAALLDIENCNTRLL